MSKPPPSREFLAVTNYSQIYRGTDSSFSLARRRRFWKARGRRLPSEVTGETFQQFRPRASFPSDPFAIFATAENESVYVCERVDGGVGGDGTERREDEGTRCRRCRCELVVHEFIAAESSSRWQRQPSYARSSLFRLTVEIFCIEISQERGEEGEKPRKVRRGDFSPSVFFSSPTHARVLIDVLRRRTRSFAHSPLHR